MSYLDLAEALVKKLEGCRLTSYQDSGGRWTIGYGHTGPEVRPGMTITQATADAWLLVDLGIADTRLNKVCSAAALAKLTDHEHATLISFVFNVGTEPQWTIWKDVNSGNLGDVPAQLLRFDKGEVDGRLQVIPGLDNRREAEKVYWNTADADKAAAIMFNDAAAPPPSSYTRDISTPPTPTPAPPMARSSLINKVVTAAGAGVAGLGTFGSQVHDIVAPHADEAHVFQAMTIGASGVVVACAIFGLLIHGQQAQQRTV